MAEQTRSRTLRCTNAFITLHGFSTKTAILNVTAINGHSPEMNHASIWVSHKDLQELTELLKQWTEEV